MSDVPALGKSKIYRVDKSRVEAFAAASIGTGIPRKGGGSLSLTVGG